MTRQYFICVSASAFYILFSISVVGAADLRDNKLLSQLSSYEL